jgi:hypothetical protein
MQTVKSIRKQIKDIARKFGLRYNKNWFSYIWVPTKVEIISEYVGNCPDPIYQKFGRSPKTRMKNFNRFLRSKAYKDLLKRHGGQVAHKDHLNEEIYLILQIKDRKIKRQMITFYSHLAKKFQSTESVAVLALPKKKEDRERQLSYCLRHEWIHILLEKNNIDFQRINPKYWAYDEGLSEFIGEYIDNNLHNLEKIRKQEEHTFEKKYVSYAIKFRQLMEYKNTSQKRKLAILRLMNILQKQSF